jgi:hypothetical protein
MLLYLYFLSTVSSVQHFGLVKFHFGLNNLACCLVFNLLLWMKILFKLACVSSKERLLMNIKV